MIIPENPILLPMPKFVQCPKCKATWFWRTWYKQGTNRTACSKCKSTVMPIPIPVPEDKIKLIKCGYCKELQWYTGNKEKTTCTKCGKKNIIVRTVKPDELEDILKDTTEEYYLDRLEEYKARQP